MKRVVYGFAWRGHNSRSFMQKVVKPTFWRHFPASGCKLRCYPLNTRSKRSRNRRSFTSALRRDCDLTILSHLSLVTLFHDCKSVGIHNSRPLDGCIESGAIPDCPRSRYKASRARRSAGWRPHSCICSNCTEASGLLGQVRLRRHRRWRFRQKTRCSRSCVANC